MITVDTRGPCPDPDIKTKKALKSNDELLLVVDDGAPYENVGRFVHSQQCAVKEVKKKDGIYFKIKTSGEAMSRSGADIGIIKPEGDSVLILSEIKMGRGDDEPICILIRSFLNTLSESANRPDAMIFFNTGGKLTVGRSELIEDLAALEKSGVRILVCATCLNYFNVKNEIESGTVSNTYDITETLLAAGKIITT
ncbi:MAG: sulfurtransferase-like selenium metabolism protein YedF [Spirochaetes bacterium]|jgi:selenium metabolism protein YedF|nr:sulfurtransferase-like selenium metabolism protein YedF [Spirochaetota bacterium]